MASGVTQVLVGHPFDTLKVWAQNPQSKPKQKSTNPLVLYRGVLFPLVGASIISGVLFTSYHYALEQTHNRWAAGFMAGLVASCVIGPVELYKIRWQSGLRGWVAPWTGWPATASRECLAASLYFGTYFMLTQDYSLPAPIAGGLAGFMS
eukprot:gene2301-3149_t